MLITSAFLFVLICNALLIWGVIRSFHHDASDSKRDTTLFEDGFVTLLALILGISWSGLLLAEAGVFSLQALSIVFAVSVLSLVVVLRKRRPFTVQLPRVADLDRYDVGALIVVVLATLLYTPPHEWIPGGADPGSYINIGINIGRTGAIHIHDGVLASIPTEYRNMFLYAISANPAYDGARFPAFYVRNIGDALVEPQFFHVFPLWIALFYQLGGITASLFATPFFAVLSLVALYLLGRRLIHPAVGLFAMVLLSMNISQLWYARTPFADIALQFFLLSGFWALTVLMDTAQNERPGATFAAIVAGACLGVAHLTKLDIVIIGPAIVGFFVYLWVIDRFLRPHAIALAVYLLLVGHTALHSYFFAWAYVTDVFKIVLSIHPLVLAGAGTMGGLLVLAFIVWQRDRIVRWIHKLEPHQETLGRAFVVVIVLISLYAYFIRPFRADLGAMDEAELARQGQVINALYPLATDPQTIQLSQEGRTFIEEGIVRVGWYLTPIGIWLGIAGFLYWVTTRLTLRALPFLGVAFMSAVLYFYRGAIVPHFFWAFKRYVPVVIPAFILFIALMLWTWWPKDRSQWQQSIPSLLIGCFLLVSYAAGSLQFWGHTQYDGAIEDLATLNKTFPDGAVILFERSDPANRIGLPLTYIHARNVFEVQPHFTNNEGVRQTISAWQRNGHPVYWMTPTCDPTIWSYGPVTLATEFDVLWPEVPTTLDSLPETIGAFSTHVCVYRIEDTEYTFPAKLDVNFDDKVKLRGYKFGTETILPGDTLHFTIYWEAEQRTDVDYKMFTHIVDSRQSLVGQNDVYLHGTMGHTSQLPAGDIVAQDIEIPIRPDIPAGTYELRVGIYDLATMHRLPVVGSSGTHRSDHVVVETIKVQAEGR